MTEAQNRIRLSLLVVTLVGVATVSMVVDRRALSGGARALPSWAGPVLDAAVPVQKTIALPVDLLRQGWARYVGLVGVGQENRRLRLELARLAEENLQLREALVASGRLARIAEMRDDFEVPMLPAELVGSDVSPWFRSVLLDKGRGHGVDAGMPVISESGLAGLVTATSSEAARGMLLLDRQSAVDGTIQRSRAQGVVRGRGDALLEFEFVARGSDVRPGDQVITSGLGGVYPKGLLVGQVREVPDPGSRLLGTALVEPAVDFRSLEQVFVMLHRGPAMDLLYGQEEGGAVPPGPRAGP